jgi:FixJ family two-component response regulator
MTMVQADDEIVYVVDDDPQMRETLKLLLDSVDIRVESFASAEDFFAQRDRFGERPECLVLDLCLPGMSGVQLQERLGEERIDIPVILITAFGDVSTAVKSMTLGAVTFLEKPFKRAEFLEQIRVALKEKSTQLEKQRQARAISGRLDTLTARERETLDHMVAGRSTKRIASVFDIGVQTVAKHQARVLEKMGVDNVVELVRLMEDLA